MHWRQLLILLWIGLMQLAQAATEVLPLNYHTADELMPLVQSILGNQGRVAAYSNQLVVTAPDPLINAVRQTLLQVDLPPRRLLISVDAQDSSNSQGYQTEPARVRLIHRGTAARGGGVQQIQTTEGYPALIQVGQQVPLTSTNTDRYGRVYQNTQYQEVLQGFYATARVSGDQVQIQLNSQRDRLDSAQRNLIQQQNSSTYLSGRLGEWISVSSIDENNSNQRNGPTQHYATQGSNNQSVRIKVELLP